MIDTLKLSKRLQAAQMSKEQAEAVAEGLSETLREAYVSREYLDAALAKLREELTFRMIVVGLGITALSNGALYFALSNLIHSLKS